MKFVFASCPAILIGGRAFGSACNFEREPRSRAPDRRFSMAINAAKNSAKKRSGTMIRLFSAFALVITAMAWVARAEGPASSRIDAITKSARDMMPAVPTMPSVSLPSPSMPDLSLPDFSDVTGRMMSEFNTFTQQVGDALPILEQMGYEVTVFKVTWGLPPKARLRLRSSGNSDIAKITAIATKATSSGVLVSALITSAATAKRIQSTMKMGTAYLDVDFAVPPRVNMKFLSLKASEKDEMSRDNDELEISCK
ncbi:hypothetical protein AAFG07_30590 [Bradyrhizobium sp. B097]|uniref:hypothetical protein n=1 Tax=Bradyrhizobium sp. B097 TaxID=3140244 RepID=UPI0031839C26